MARRTLVGLALIALIVGLSAPVDARPADPGHRDGVSGADHPDAVPGSWIVTLRPGADAAGESNDMARAHGGRAGHVYDAVLNGFQFLGSTHAAENLARNPRVRRVEADRRVDTAHHCPFPGHSHCDPPDDEPVDPTEPADPRVPTGVQRSFGPGTGTIGTGIAILDTGIASHRDLNVAGGYNCTTANRDAWGDVNGHGTHVAGSAAARGNATSGGVLGVAPGAPLYAVKVLDNSGSGSWASVICGVNWVTANNNTIDVANMSLGGSGSAGDGCSSTSLRQAICDSVKEGVTYTVAAGNSNVAAGTSVPAAYPEVITVAALADFDGEPGGLATPTCRSDTDDTLANFSNWGEAVDIIAPGVCIESTVPGDKYATYSGTSMAAPHAAGAVALYLRAHTGATPAQVMSGLQALGNLGWTLSTWKPGSSTAPRLLDVRTLLDGETGGNQPPLASFTSTCTGLTCEFDGSASTDSDGTITSYIWSFGDDGTDSGATVEHAYAADGSYTVTLTVTDNEGATGSTSQSVSVTAPSQPSEGTPVGVSSIVRQPHNRHFDFTVRLDPAISGANVSITATRDGSSPLTGTGTTGNDGTVTFRIQHGGSNCYAIEVTSVTASGYDWDGLTPSHDLC